MAQEKLLTVRDVSLILGITEREVVDLAESQAIPAYKIGGVYLRFKPDQIEEFKKAFNPTQDKNKISVRYPLKDRLNDFLYFNDFYILAFLIILLILFIILRIF